MRARRIALGIALALLLDGGVAFADARSKARKNFEEGMRLIDAKKFQPGIDALIRANEILPHPDVQYNIARACVEAGMIPEAIQWFETYLGGSNSPRDEAEVRDAIRSLRARLPEPSRPERSRDEELPDGETPLEDPPAAPRPTKALPLPKEMARDIDKLEQLAADVRPLNEERAREIGALAMRMRELAAIAQANGREPKREDPKPPVLEAPPLTNPTADPATPLNLPAQALREVEEYQEQEVVTAATRNAASAKDAPAVVWVITQQEIRTRGYESVAEALRAVAGLHVIDDHVFVDVGVRGVHAGLRGMSRIIKVLIDDHPIAFRPTSGNLLGLEMIPIRAIDRIELIRGPASALYGANAFLGVLQIVTRRGGDIRGGSVTARGGLTTSTRDAAGGLAVQGSGSLDLIAGTEEGDLSLLMAAQISRLNRSGLSLPSTSPFVNELNMMRRGPSQGDTATPVALFGSINYQLRRRGTLSVQSGLQKLESHAEWLDYGALTHFSKVSLTNFWIRLGYDQQASDEVGFRLFTSYSEGGPTDQNRVRPLEAFSLLPNENRHFTEDFTSRAIFSGAEVRWDLKRFNLSTRLGADLDVDAERLASARAVFDRAEGTNNQPGDSIPLAAAQLPEKTFTDVGLYLQVSSNPIAFMDLIGGLRYDYHNLYGSAVNGRLGSVFRLSNLFFVKALYGSSFRAPAADQLYRESAYIGDTTGCIDYIPCQKVGLRPQTAHTGELVLGVSYEETFTAQATGFLSFVDDLIISFPNNTNSFVTTNAGTYLSKGLELELSLKLPGTGRAFSLASHAYLSIEDTTTDVPQSLFEPAESIRAEYRQASLFPNLSAGGGVDFAWIPAHLGLYLEARYVGPRRASGSNLALSLGDSNYDGDNLPGYVEIDANLSTRDLYIVGQGETMLSLRVTDIIGQPHAEGGYRGWDIPSIGRMIFFRLIQEF